VPNNNRLETTTETRSFLINLDWPVRASRETRMSDYHINVFYSDEDSGYIPDLKYRSAFDGTPEEAVR